MISPMSSASAVQHDPIVLHAIDRSGRAIDLAPAWPLLDRLLCEWKPMQIHLFGSRARGDANPDSDWDFLVVVPEACSATDDPLIPWRLRSDTGVRADIVVYSLPDFESERAVPQYASLRSQLRWGCAFGALVSRRFKASPASSGAVQRRNAERLRSCLGSSKRRRDGQKDATDSIDPR